MSVSFLTPGAEGVAASSSMERRALAAGGKVVTADGWKIVRDFGEPTLELDRISRTVGFADRSALTKIEVLGEPQAVTATLARAGAPPLALGTASRTTGTWWCLIAPSRALVISERHEPDLRSAVEDADGVGFLDVTSGLAAMSLVGPGARELLARFCAIDVRPSVAPPASFRPGSVARTPGYLLVEREDGILLLVGWALGEYLWEVVADAAEQLGGGPVGADVLADRLEALDA
jgi:sarcosine oxidase gamma subunit